MYDILYVSKALLPLTDEQQTKIPANPGWQTKDFGCMLTEIYITDERDLKINRWTDGEDEDGVFTRENERLDVIEHHGWVNFYPSFDKEWFQFRAKFTDGKLVIIERVTS